MAIIDRLRRPSKRPAQRGSGQDKLIRQNQMEISAPFPDSPWIDRKFKAVPLVMRSLLLALQIYSTVLLASGLGQALFNCPRETQCS
jgi:hypothetical protein